MNRTIMLCAAAALTAVALPASALAAGPGGPRVEVFVGYDAADLEYEDDGTTYDLHNKGIFYGIGGGYDFPLSGMSALGVDVEISDSSADDSNDGFLFDVSDKFGFDFYVGGRASFAVMDRATIYLKGGYTNLQVKAALNVCGFPSFETAGIGLAVPCFDTEVFDDSGSVDGFRAGGGIDIALFGRTYAGVEYRFSSYDDDINRQQMMVKLGMRF